MTMLFKMVEPKYVAHPVLARALDIIFILHADHEQNCSTNVMRSVWSALAAPFVCTAARHRCAVRPAARRRERGSSQDARRNRRQGKHPAYVERVKAGKGKLMGFGHRVYKNYDPRARIVKWTSEQVFEVTGKNPKLEIALRRMIEVLQVLPKSSPGN
jgi:citrate synthase